MKRSTPSIVTVACLAAGLLVAVAVTAGCAATRDITPAAGLGDPYPAPLNDPQISVLDEGLRQWLFFHPAIIVKDTVLHVQVPVRNVAERQYLVDYRILFYDENGLELEPVMDWEMAPLYPKETVRLKSNSMDNRAESFRIELKWAR